MIYRALLIIFLFAISCACNSENNSLDNKIENPSFENTLMSFSDAVSKKDTTKLASIINADGIHLVRKFTSGNLGGRGEEFSGRVPAASINNQLEFPVKQQTPLNLDILFPELPIKSYKKLPQYKITEEFETLVFDKWEALLKKSLQEKPEAITGDPLLFFSGSKYWMYVEAQIIDDILVGGLAVFEEKDANTKLVAIIEFL